MKVTGRMRSSCKRSPASVASLSFMFSGLGTGISANAFMRHKIPTTIVEIDPAVYNAARKWFGLADPGVGRVFFDDARSWVADKHANIQAGKEEVLYDIVVHDCFSGGGVPEHIFTVEFWDELTTIMAPGAVLVVVSCSWTASKTQLTTG